MKSNFIQTIIGNLDAIVLIIATAIALILEYTGVVPKEQIFTVILLLLCLIAIHAVRRSFKIEEIGRRVETIEGGIAEVKSSIGFMHTTSSEENWRIATGLAKFLKKESNGYDTSSYPNKEEFENEVLNGIKRWAIYRRLVCFSSEKNEYMRNWFLSQVCAKNDKSGRYQILRDALRDGRAMILHYPMELDTDYFIIEEGHDPKAGIIGFCTGEDVKKALVYSAGIRVENKGAIKDLIELFTNVLWEKAKEHLREQQKLPLGDRCICSSSLGKNFEHYR